MSSKKITIKDILNSEFPHRKIQVQLLYKLLIEVSYYYFIL